MLKRLTVWLLMFAVLSTNFSTVFVYAGFKANQAYIARTLCVNRNQPWLHCNGKCYFMRKIKQAEENEKKQETKDNLSRLEVSFFQQPNRVAFIEPAILEPHKNVFPPYTHQYSSSYIETIFRPPKQAA